jgi:hypothetical protein
MVFHIKTLENRLKIITAAFGCGNC